MGAMDIEQLRARVRGTLIQPGDGEYDSGATTVAVSAHVMTGS